MELLDLPFAFTGSWFCIHHTDAQPCKGRPDLFCDILCPIIKVTGIEGSIPGNRLMERIFNDCFFLVLCQEKVQIKCNQFSLF